MRKQVTPHDLTRPNGLALTRAKNRASYVYLEYCNIQQAGHGISVTNTNEPDASIHIPVATLTALLLGPGTTITHSAATTIAYAGATCVFTGSGGTRSYTSITPQSSATTLLEKQIEIVTNPELRNLKALWMYTKRFPDNIPLPENLSINALRGLEGARMKAVYALQARKYKLPRWTRQNGRDGREIDNVNTALNHANTALYGICHGVISILGLSPAIGIVHTGHRNSFTLDIADLYKTETTIPLAFSLHHDDDPGPAIRRSLRDKFTLIKLIPAIVNDIETLLDQPQTQNDSWDVDELHLWDADKPVPAGWNWA